MAAAMASPCPVLPEVGSTMVPPGLSRPACSATSIIRRPMRSLTLPPGFSISSLARMVAWTPRVTFRKRTSGVCPTASRNVSMISIARFPQRPPARSYCRTEMSRCRVRFEALHAEAGPQSVDGGEDLVGRRPLEDVFGRAGIQHLEHVHGVGVCGEGHDHRGRGVEEDLARGPGPAPAR